MEQHQEHSQEHHQEHHHIMSYNSLGVILLILLGLTFSTIFVTQIELKAWTVAAALLIACTKGFIVLSYFMHLKYDKPVFRWMVGTVFLLFAVVIFITYIDYFFR